MGSEDAKGRQMEPSVFQGIEERRKSSGGPGGMDPSSGRILGKMQLIHAVGEHGRITRRGIEPPFIDLRDVGENLRRDPPGAGDQGG